MYGPISRHPWLSFAVAWVVVFVSTGAASYLTAPGSTLPRPPFGSGPAAQVAPETGGPTRAAPPDEGLEAAQRPHPGPTPAPPAGPPNRADRGRAVLDGGRGAADSGDGAAGEAPPEVRGTRTPPGSDLDESDSEFGSERDSEPDGEPDSETDGHSGTSTAEAPGLSESRDSTDGSHPTPGRSESSTEPEGGPEPEPTESETPGESPTPTSTSTTSPPPGSSGRRTRARATIRRRTRPD